MKQLLLFLIVFAALGLNAQTKSKTSVVAFYNLENLFDTEDDTLIRDEEYLPSGSKNWTIEKYNEKLENMAKVISLIGKKFNPDGAAIVGVSEIENRKVLDDLVVQKSIKDRHYKIVQYNSPDKRGIDVAMLYNPKYFTLLSSKPLKVQPIKHNGDTVFTRDILLVTGMMDGQKVHILVNHWSSRWGGEKGSRWKRNFAAKVCKKAIDSLEHEDQNAFVMVMGDFNDNPTNQSIKKHLNAKPKKKNLKQGEMYNPFLRKYYNGIGSNAYRDAWSLFDQIIVSKNVVENKGYHFYKARVFKEEFLINQTGHFKGYPKRTFGGGSYLGGYSDHFPSFIVLAKRVD